MRSAEIKRSPDELNSALKNKLKALEHQEGIAPVASLRLRQELKKIIEGVNDPETMQRIAEVLSDLQPEKADIPTMEEYIKKVQGTIAGEPGESQENPFKDTEGALEGEVETPADRARKRQSEFF